MMELFLSSDGKHTVHVAAETPDKLIELLPQAKLVYEAVVRAHGGTIGVHSVAGATEFTVHLPR